MSIRFTAMVALCALAFITFTTIGCAAGGKHGKPAEPDRLQSLATLMAGSFSSAAQAEQDKDYFDIRLHMCRVWTDRADGPWLYVEQARADMLDKPYRQRVYRLSREAGPDAFRSDVYELPDPAACIGAWKTEKPLAGVNPQMLVLKEGCAVHLVFDPASGSYKGSTQGNGCASNLRGAAYATSEVTISETGIFSWDRGYDAAGKQVWGAEKGGYRFIKEAAPVCPLPQPKP